MYYTYGQGEDGLYDYYQAKDGSGNLLYPAGYYDDPRTLTEAEQKAWASNIGVSGIGLSESESMLGLFARRLEFNNSPMMMENFFEWIVWLIGMMLLSALVSIKIIMQVFRELLNV